jgi:hypothetical protein
MSLWMPTGLPALSSTKSIRGSRTMAGRPLRGSTLVSMRKPITFSGGTPYIFSLTTRRNSTPPPETTWASKPSAHRSSSCSRMGPMVSSVYVCFSVG